MALTSKKEINLHGMVRGFLCYAFQRNVLERNGQIVRCDEASTAFNQGCLTLPVESVFQLLCSYFPNFDSREETNCDK